MSLDHLAVFSFKIVCVWKLSFTKLTLKLRQSHRTTEANFTCQLSHQSSIFTCQRSTFTCRRQQAWIHTSFHHFTESGQIFHNTL